MDYPQKGYPTDFPKREINPMLHYLQGSYVKRSNFIMNLV